MGIFPVPLTSMYLLPISLLFGLGCVGLVLMIVLAVYNDPRRNSCAATTLILLGFACAIGFLSMFPTDIALSLALNRYNSSKYDAIDDDASLESDILGDDGSLHSLLRTIYVATYWFGLLLSCVVLPATDLVINSGAFGTCGRIHDAAMAVAKMLMGGVAAIALVTGIGMAAGWVDDPSFLSNAEVSCVAVSNTLGFIKITLLLAYGLVELPRRTWKQSFFNDWSLNRHLLMVAREKKDVDEARADLQLALIDWYRYEDMARRMTHESGRLLEVIFAHSYIKLIFVLMLYIIL